MTTTTQDTNDFDDLDVIDKMPDLSGLQARLEGADAVAAMAAEKEAMGLANEGSVEAAELLIGVYSSGTTAIAADRIKEFKYTRMAADLGSSFSRYWLARIQRESGDFTSALENARLGHEMGSVPASMLLARMMLAGEGQSAKPLEALELLSDTIEANAGTGEATLLLVEVHLDGKYIPKNPQKAYELLQREAMDFKVMRTTAPAEYARYLFLKAEALKMGAVAVEGESHATLIKEAAEAGDSSARSVQQGMRSDEEGRGRLAEWESFSKFESYNGHWNMFIKFGRLIHCADRSHSTTSGYNGTISTTTVRWQLATFQERSGEQFEVKIPDKVKPVRGRSFAVVYVGPAKDTSGVPTLLYDLEGGKAFRTNSVPFSSYPENFSKAPAVFANLLLMVALIAAIVVFNTASVLAILVTGGAGYFGWTMRQKFKGGYELALKQATAFFDKHRQALL